MLLRSPTAMASCSLRLIASFVLLASLSSCKDDPVLVKKREEQRLEIGRLEQEIAALEAKLQDIPPDRTKELEKSLSVTVEQKAEIQKLEAHAAELEARKRDLEDKLSSQRLRYPPK